MQIERHHIKPKSEGGSNKRSNLRDLCQDCHDYVHAVMEINKRIERYQRMLRLYRHRLNVLRKFNKVELIRQFGYRTYWKDLSTHGGRK